MTSEVMRTLSDTGRARTQGFSTPPLPSPHPPQRWALSHLCQTSQGHCKGLPRQECGAWALVARGLARLQLRHSCCLEELRQKVARSTQVGFTPQCSSGSSSQICPSARDPAGPITCQTPDFTLTSFLSCLPTAAHHHTLLALPPKQTSQPPPASHPMAQPRAPDPSISHLESCPCPYPPIHPPH